MTSFSTATVRTASLADVARHFNLMLKRADKLGMAQPTLAVGEPYNRERTVRLASSPTTAREVRITEEVADVTLTMPEALVLPGGWRFLASLDCEGATPIVSNPTGADIPAAILAAHGECDHCQTKRRRVHTVVVESEDGRVLQVGKSCLREFLGDANFAVDALTKFEPGSFFDAFDGDGESDRDSYGRGDFGLDVEQFTRAALAAVDTWGWTSRKVANEHNKAATADRVSDMIWARGLRGGYADEVNAARDLAAIDAAIFAEAKAAIEWATSLAGSASEYERNLAEVAQRGNVRTRHFGLLVSLASAYRRHVEHETMRRKERETLVDAPTGRVEIEGEILTAKVRETMYGCTLKLLLMCDAEGGKFKVWVSAPKALTSNETEPGVRVRMTATLKPSDDDASFAFGSRPAKAVALARD